MPAQKTRLEQLAVGDLVRIETWRSLHNDKNEFIGIFLGENQSPMRTYKFIIDEEPFNLKENDIIGIHWISRFSEAE